MSNLLEYEMGIKFNGFKRTAIVQVKYVVSSSQEVQCLSPTVRPTSILVIAMVIRIAKLLRIKKKLMTGD